MADVIVPELTEEEQLKVKEQVEEQAKKSDFPTAPDYPLADKVEEMGIMAKIAEDPEFFEDLKTKSHSFYSNMKNTPHAIAKKYYPVGD